MRFASVCVVVFLIGIYVMDEIKQEDCEHIWVANSGEGGDPDYRWNRQISLLPIMDVKCEICNAKTWKTREQWEALEEV